MNPEISDKVAFSLIDRGTIGVEVRGELTLCASFFVPTSYNEFVDYSVASHAAKEKIMSAITNLMIPEYLCKNITEAAHELRHIYCRDLDEHYRLEELSNMLMSALSKARGE